MKWAIREAIDVYFKAKTILKLGARTIRAGEPVLIFDTVKTSTFEVAAAISYVTGGRGNSRILSYEGDKTLTFQFEDALLSAEGLAILSGADLIPARNKHLPGSPKEARSIISHFTEKYSVSTPSIPDVDTTNSYDVDPAISGKPRGGHLNVWLTRRPYTGQNASLYVMLLDHAGEMSGAPIEVNLKTDPGQSITVDGKSYTIGSEHTYLAKFNTANNKFIAFNYNGAPMSLTDYPAPTNAATNGVFDDQVAHYVDPNMADASWHAVWGDKADYIRTVVGTSYSWDTAYTYLMAPAGGIAQPRAFKEGAQIVYKANVPSVLFQDIVLLDYYVEYDHDATQVSILPDKFGPYMYVEGSSLVRRASDGMDLPVEFVIPKFKVTTALTFTLQSTGDPSTFTFQGDAYPDFSKFDLTRKVLADIQILDADDNFDGATGDQVQSDPTSYRRYHYSRTEGEYLWKDPSMEPHSNLDYSDTGNYIPTDGGAAARTPGLGVIDTGRGTTPPAPPIPTP
jgi:hypothetical protein